MKLRLFANYSWSGNHLEQDQFGFFEGVRDGVEVTEFVMRCPNRKRFCNIPVILGAPSNTGPHHLWGWDGNKQEPTLIPSIGCDQRCGWHGHVTKGVRAP